MHVTWLIIRTSWTSISGNREREVYPADVSGKEVYKQDTKIMPTDRCTHLIMKALYWRYDEVWISDQPILAITYLAEYTPGLMRYLMKNFIGPSRIKAFQDGGSVFDIKFMLKNILSGK